MKERTEKEIKEYMKNGKRKVIFAQFVIFLIVLMLILVLILEIGLNIFLVLAGSILVMIISSLIFISIYMDNVKEYIEGKDENKYERLSMKERKMEGKSDYELFKPLSVSILNVKGGNPLFIIVVNLVFGILFSILVILLVFKFS